jgi:hypothetical protein
MPISQISVLEERSAAVGFSPALDGIEDDLEKVTYLLYYEGCIEFRYGTVLPGI